QCLSRFSDRQQLVKFLFHLCLSSCLFIVFSFSDMKIRKCPKMGHRHIPVVVDFLLAFFHFSGRKKMRGAAQQTATSLFYRYFFFSCSISMSIFSTVKLSSITSS